MKNVLGPIIGIAIAAALFFGLVAPHLAK